ncbi:MAG: GH3 auxin-responsive promoter family protein [Bacillota bacterium]|nr:GH3 auxin-responsive promoter family protein [Bacillota bacterium]
MSLFFNLIYKAVIFYGNSILKKQEKSIKNYKKVQQETLKIILKKNADCEYGKLYDFSSIQDEKEYIANVPLATFKNFRPYVDRMLRNGEGNVLFSDSLTGWASTSATSGNKKYIPQTRQMGIIYLSDYGFKSFALANRIYKQRTGKSLKSGHMLLMLGNVVEQAGQEELPLTSIDSASLLQVKSDVKDIAIPPLKYLTSQNKFESGYALLIFTLCPSV